MKSILDEFHITKDNLRYFDEEIIDRIPRLNFPARNSKIFENDIKEVQRCFNNPSMNTSFLMNADENINGVFKSYCLEKGYNNIDWKKIKKITKEVNKITDTLKKEYNRPRPIYNLEDGDKLKIKYKKSPSYPSGHTTVAYFICDIISKHIPDARQDLQTLAGLIGQSRIENAVHYPTDIQYGRLVGEFLASNFNNEQEFIDRDLTKKDYKNIREKIKNNTEDPVNDLANFILYNNNYKNKNCSYQDCIDASLNFLNGYPPKYCSKNKYITSNLDAITAANKISDIDTIYKLQIINEYFDESVLDYHASKGRLRSEPYMTPNGQQCAEPSDFSYIFTRASSLFKKKPAVKHAILHWVRPFEDANGRSLRVALLKDLDFDICRLNEFMSDSYYENINKFIENNEIISKIKM